MQVNKVNTLVQADRKNINNKNNPSFKAMPGVVDGFALDVAGLIENGGLAVSFTLQDMLGTNLPRPITGLFRNNKENNGEKNTKFALKELVREMMTGPSMFIIPGVLFGVAKKIFGKTVSMPVKVIKSLGDIHAANPLNEAGKAISKEEFYKNVFTEMIKNAKSETQVTEETAKTAADFAKRLSTELQSQKPKPHLKDSLKSAKDNLTRFMHDKGALKESASALKNNLVNGKQNAVIDKLSDDFIAISKGHAKDAAHTDFTQAALSPSVSAPFKETLKHVITYADDVVEKAGSKNTGNLKNYIQKVTNNKVITRFAANVGIYAATLAFLQMIPKLYNKAEGEENAGLKGLMKKETLNDESLDDKKQSVNASEIKETKKETNVLKDKSKPSFGSSTGFVNKIAGQGLAGRIAGGLEYSGCNVSFPMLLGIMGGGILLPRIRNSKDKYDREEIIRRDATTCAVMCFAEKELRKGFSKLNEASSGFVLAAKDKSFEDKKLPQKIFDYLRPIKGVRLLSTDEIVSKYSGIDKYKDGITGFCDFIDNQGGNLSKIFSNTKESKDIVQSLLSKEGKDIASANNNSIKETLAKAAESEEVKKLTGLFEDKNNPWVTKAKTLNARFTALSVLVLVPVFLGFLLPRINESKTKKRIKREEEEKRQLYNTAQTDAAYFGKDQQTQKIFSDIQKNIQK